ncbi:MAG: 4-alpha-glucanotransferase [Oscillospiraceae bacterium]|nr:4-alpha-glucanotransferase [Ruminococcus sp.]OLA69386.1 MAG: 4-alpha-glucanotransferase [Ruminococcus sp. 37_24]
MRKSGILMHISSLPSKYGIGKMGKSAYDFVDFLVSAGVKCWQILPLSPTSYGDSPYQSFSVYAGNPYFIDFETLKREGLIKKSDYEDIKWQDNDHQVNYSIIYNNCFKVLRQAYKTYKRDISKRYKTFVEKNSSWLDDYALFMALKFKNNGKPWYEWDKKLAMRDSNALKKASEELEKETEFFKFIQYKFFRQWSNLKKYANDKGVEIIGDMPIYVSYDSVEAWVSPELFQFDKHKKPKDVAGCPPDDFAVTGQLWGNPLYDWEYHKKTGYKWWIDRLQFSASIYDIVRIDHFRGFESYYAVPYGDETAENGEWRKGPGAELFKAAEKALGKLNIIAEDLGFITEDVYKMLADVGYPGMKILQFAFGEDSANEHLPHNFTSSNCIAYTGTHDNETLKGWVSSQSSDTLKYCMAYLGVKKKKDIPKNIIKQTWASVAQTAIAQMQDFLNSDASARMNTPSTLGNNWQFRTSEDDFTDKLAKRILKLNKMYNR